MKYTDIPSIRLLKRLHAHRMDASQGRNVLSWLLKTVVLEPFGLIEMGIYNRKIKAHTLPADPVFILGFYRSGTTYLQRLFAHDPQFGYQTVFDTAFPNVMLSLEQFLLPVLKKGTELMKPANRFQRVILSWDQPGEEDVAMVSLGMSETVNWGHFFPSVFEHYFTRYGLMNPPEEVLDKWKASYRYWVQKLSFKTRRQLVLKNPPNTARIPELLSLFPDARFVFIHRDPFAVYASNLYLWKIIEESYAFQRISDDRAAWLTLWAGQKTMARYLETRHQIPAGHLVEIAYEQLLEDPVERLGEVYAALGLSGFEQARQHLQKSPLLSKSYRQTEYMLSDREKEAVQSAWGELYGQIQTGAMT